VNSDKFRCAAISLLVTLLSSRAIRCRGRFVGPNSWRSLQFSSKEPSLAAGLPAGRHSRAFCLSETDFSLGSAYRVPQDVLVNPRSAGKQHSPFTESALSERSIVEALRAKVSEAVERTDHLVSLVTEGSLAWQPQIASSNPSAMDVGHLLGHLLDCLSGFCACFQKAFPEHLAGLDSLRGLEVNHFCPPGEARERIAEYGKQIERGFLLCLDSDLSRVLQTIFAPKGETLMTLLLGNLEHLLNHKYQLFLYVKLQGLPVTSRDLYRFREKRER